MLTVKLMKFSPKTYSGSTDGPTTLNPRFTEAVVIHPATAVFIECNDKHGRQVVGIQNPKGDEILRVTVGDEGQTDTEFSVAYIVNAEGRIVETVR
jgi:hypothetical protein